MSADAAFAATLLDPTLQVPPGWASRPGADPQRRLDVYRNNVVHSLSVALGEAFPVCREFVGGAFFDALAPEFVREHPPRSPVLAEWGGELASFIERFAPAAAVPVLADLARLEWARQCAWHAADAPAADLAALVQALAQPQALDTATAWMHPSLRVLALRSAAVSVWAAHQGQESNLDDLAAVNAAQSECAWVLRPGDEVRVIPVSAAQAAWAHAACNGATLGQAQQAASGIEDDSPFDLAATLALALQQGALCGLRLADSQLSN